MIVARRVRDFVNVVLRFGFECFKKRVFAIVKSCNDLRRCPQFIGVHRGCTKTKYKTCAPSRIDWKLKAHGIFFNYMNKTVESTSISKQQQPYTIFFTVRVTLTVSAVTISKCQIISVDSLNKYNRRRPHEAHKTQSKNP